MPWSKTTTYFCLCRDIDGNHQFYQPIAVIEYTGQLSNSGEFTGHYTCDVKEYLTNNWYRTNDSKIPKRISSSDVSKLGYVVLFKHPWISYVFNIVGKFALIVI